MALSGSPVGVLVPVGEKGIARAVTAPGGMIVLVEPETGDRSGMSTLANLLTRAPHKPEVLVVARNFNPFTFGLLLPGITVNHVKGRGKNFLKQLPALKEGVPVAAPLVLKSKKKSKNENMPLFEFVGREEELATLTEQLSVGGPIVVSGPSGVGRNWLVEHAIATAELNRYPDLELGYGVGFDTLIARLAEIGTAHGSSALSQLLGDPSRTPTQLIDKTLETLTSAEVAAGHVMVIRNLDRALGRQSDFFQKSRLELLLEALLTHQYGLRLVFISRSQPVFYREGAAQHLRRLEVGGIAGKTYYDIFQAYHAPEFPRDQIGPLVDKLHGHPLAIRSYATALQTASDAEALLNSDKFLKLERLSHIAPLEKHLAKRIEKLPKALREALATLAHVRGPAPGNVFAELGVNRKLRMELLALGMLDMFGTAKNRQYRVHPLVRSQLRYRELSDFNTSARLAEIYYTLAGSSEGVQKLAHLQEGNRCAHQARRARSIQETGYINNDATLESCYGMVRSKQPRYDLAGPRIAEVLEQDPSNADAHLLKIELLSRSQAKPAAVEAAFEEAVDKAPVPEVFHQTVNYLLGRRAKGKAISTLERSVEILPNESRLHTRLASLLLRQGRRPEAITHLEKAMALAPMLPDAYGILGMARRAEGASSLEVAESLFREAVRLAPEDAVQLSRLVYLLLEKARGASTVEERDTYYAESIALLEPILQSREKSPEVFLLMAQITRESSDDINRAQWLLKQARSNTPRGHERNRRIQVETALLEIRAGKIDEAEARLRQLGQKDPSNPHIFAALALVLEARGQYIPAHAELLRSRERVSPNSLQFAGYERELLRLQAIIEAQASGLMAQTLPQPATPKAPTPNPTGHQRVIRRKKEKTAAPQAAAVEPTALEELPVPEQLEVAPAEAPTEGEDEAPAGGEDEAPAGGEE
jgi:tetratricopeptide (TPR) repeat protein